MFPIIFFNPSGSKQPPPGRRIAARGHCDVSARPVKEIRSLLPTTKPENPVRESTLRRSVPRRVEADEADIESGMSQTPSLACYGAQKTTYTSFLALRRAVA